jgi:hypothetical protein
MSAGGGAVGVEDEEWRRWGVVGKMLCCCWRWCCCWWSGELEAMMRRRSSDAGKSARRVRGWAIAAARLAVEEGVEVAGRRRERAAREGAIAGIGEGEKRRDPGREDGLL